MKKGSRLTYNQLLETINKEEFLAYYFNHNILDTATHYNTIPQNITKYCREINYQKDKIINFENKVPKNELQNYYLNHTYKETLNHFNITVYVLNKLIKLYKINKP